MVSTEQLQTIADRIIEYGEFYDTDIEEIYPYQRLFAYRIIESIIKNDGAQLLGEWARQSGKTSTFGIIMPSIMAIIPELAKDSLFEGTELERFKNGIKIGIFAPTSKQASNMFRKIKRNVRTGEYKELVKTLGISVISSKVDYVELSNGSYLQVQSAATTSKIETFTFDLVIIDEAQDIESSVITKSIFPMLASTLGTSCLIGSPKFDISDCYFYNVIQIAKDDPKRRHNYFRYDSDIVQEYNPRYKKFLQEQRASIGETSVEYQMSYKLVWPTERGMFITDDCFKGTGEWGGRGIVGGFDWIKEKRAGIQVAGIDWGKNNGDTVVTIGDVPQESVMDYDDTITFTLNIISMLLLHGDDYESQYGDVIEFLGNYGVVQLNVDATAGSVGDPLYDKLINDARLSHINIRGVPFTTPNKSRLYKQLQTEFQGGRIHIAGGPTARRTRLYADARKELIGLVKKHSNSGHLIVNKNPHKKNAKDDIPDSICLCLDAAKSYFEEGASAGENMFFAPTRIRRAQNNSVGISRGRQLVHIRG